MTFTTCPWLVEQQVTFPFYEVPEDWDYDKDGDPNDFSHYDGPSTEIVECGAPIVRLDADGWACEAGHEHLTYGSPAQQAAEREEALREMIHSTR